MTFRDCGKKIIPVIGLTALITALVISAGELSFASQAGGHGAGSGIRPDQWFNLLYRVINFVLLAGILVWALKKPVSKMLSDRQAGIKMRFDELETKKVEVERLYAEHEKKLATIEQEAKKVMQEYIEQGKAEKERIIQEAVKVAESIKKQAEVAVEQEFKKARVALSSDVAEHSVALATELIKKNLDASDHQRLIEEYIAKVVHKN